MRRIQLRGAQAEAMATREWLVTNGLGGYASGTIAGPPTRRYHSLLVAALPAPVGRVALVSGIDECIRCDERDPGWLTRFVQPPLQTLSEFRLAGGLPVWTFVVGDITIERRLFMPYQQNTTLSIYTVLQAPRQVQLRLRPQLQPRQHEAPVDAPLGGTPVCIARPRHVEITLGSELPTLLLMATGGSPSFHSEPAVVEGVSYARERERGYPDRADAWSPGYYEITLEPGAHATLAISTESRAEVEALSADDAWRAEMERRTRLLVAAGHPKGLAAELVLAADQFIVQPAARRADEARVRAFGEHACSVIAGYHWFTDWGRDTMISLDGLMLATGRPAEARATLLTFAYHLRDGLLPNLFPEGSQEGLYNTADATLWFFHAIDRYVTVTGDVDTLRLLLPALDEVVACHMRGTRFGIHVAADGLLVQGDPAYALTWMDAKVDAWIVTPRRGKAVEINALWYNALELLAGWHRDSGRDASELDAAAARALASFNARFWFAHGGYLYDIVDGEGGDDASCRPNQILSLALRHPVLDPSRWHGVLGVVTDRLLTPFGLRTLDPADPMFKAEYFGDVRARDAAYHQGTVWPWLLGPFVEAWLRVHPGEEDKAHAIVSGFTAHLNEACIGTIGEIFDGSPPFKGRGCVAQAWSVAEVLRCLQRLEPAVDPTVRPLAGQQA